MRVFANFTALGYEGRGDLRYAEHHGVEIRLPRPSDRAVAPGQAKARMPKATATSPPSNVSHLPWALLHELMVLTIAMAPPNKAYAPITRSNPKPVSPGQTKAITSSKDAGYAC